MKNYIFRFVVLTLLFLSGAPIPTSVMAENREMNTAAVPGPRTVKGRVVDEKGTPLPGVTVRIKGTQMGTATDVDGRFELPVPENGKYALIFSFVGYRVREVDANTDLSKVVLKESADELDEVVVNRYQKK